MIEQVTMKLYEELRAEAGRKGWKTPLNVNGLFTQRSWINYWQACKRYEKDPRSGRPVVPHRSGR